MIHTHRSFDAQSIKLVIFDLDGTLIDSRSTWCIPSTRLFDILDGLSWQMT